MAEEYPPSDFNPFTPFASLESFGEPLIRAEWYRSPTGHHLQVRQYLGNFDVGENLAYFEIGYEDGGLRRDFNPSPCEAALRDAGYAVTGPWTQGDRGGLDAPVTEL
jgi:hypothetical protein